MEIKGYAEIDITKKYRYLGLITYQIGVS